MRVRRLRGSVLGRDLGLTAWSDSKSKITTAGSPVYRSAAGAVCHLGRGLSFRRLVADQRQADLAATVDINDLDLQLLADLDNVLDLVDPLALTELADVDQAILARQQGDKRTERGGLDHRTQEPLPHLRQLRVGDRVDPINCRLRGRSVGRTHVDRAVVLDGDLGTSVFLDAVDHLALGANDRADLVDRDLHHSDTRCVWAHLVRAVNRLAHDLENEQSGIAGLGQRAGQYFGRDAVELRV